MLTGVTLTGADDKTDPRELIAISREYPFVEWGLLVGSHSGVPRFPTVDWFDRLADYLAQGEYPHVKFSIHLCGRPLRQLLSGNWGGLHIVGEFIEFDRCQLNIGNRVLLDAEIEYAMLTMAHDWISPLVIVQVHGAHTPAILEKMAASWCGGVNALYDRSGGRGISPEAWPSPDPRWGCGYAGGIGPDNVLDELARIEAIAGEQAFWIDMESKLRDANDIFDLDRCRSVLESVAAVSPALLA